MRKGFSPAQKTLLLLTKGVIIEKRRRGTRSRPKPAPQQLEKKGRSKNSAETAETDRKGSGRGIMRDEGVMVKSEKKRRHAATEINGEVGKRGVNKVN